MDAVKGRGKSESIFRAVAHNTAAESENKIHDDEVAAAYGFRGGLVPGVTVYGYMVPAILDFCGSGWIGEGTASIRFHAPCYEGEVVVARCGDAGVTAEREDGSIYASGTVSKSRELSPGGYPAGVLPATAERPVASAETIRPSLILGAIREVVDVANETAIPERLLKLANEILVRNFRMSPWIHAGSQVTHHSLAVPGEEIEVRGAIEECFDRKGRSFAVAGLAMSAGGRAVASVRHTFIYRLALST